MNWPLALVFATCVQSILLIQFFSVYVARVFDAGEEWLGFLAGAETGSAALGSLLVVMFAKRLTKRFLSMAAVVAFCGNALSYFAQDLNTLLLARILCGFGAGIICSIAYKELLRADDTVKVLGIALAIQSLFLMASFLVIPYLESVFSGALFLVVGVWFVVMIGALPLISYTPVVATKVKLNSSNRISIGLFVAATLSLYACHGAFDTFIAELASQKGMSLVDISQYMLVACAVGFPVGILAAKLGNSMYVLTPYVLALCTLLLAVALLSIELDYIAFMVIVVLYNFGWVFALPFLLQAANSIYNSDRLVSGMLFMQALGMAFGAIIGGELAYKIDIITALQTLIPISVLVSFVAFLGLVRFNQQKNHDALQPAGITR